MYLSFLNFFVSSCKSLKNQREEWFQFYNVAKKIFSNVLETDLRVAYSISRVIITRDSSHYYKRGVWYWDVVN